MAFASELPALPSEMWKELEAPERRSPPGRPQRAPISKPEGKANPEVRHQVPAHTQYNKLWLLANVLYGVNDLDVNSLGSTHLVAQNTELSM